MLIRTNAFSDMNTVLSEMTKDNPHVETKQIFEEKNVGAY